MAGREDDHDDLRELLRSMASAPDFSAARANAKLETHEAVCSERYRGIVDGMAVLHERLNSMSNRMWAIAGAAIVMALAATASLVVLILTRGLK